MKYATVCSGIEAPSMAWHPLGWKPVWFSEIEDFPSAVLNHYYPDTPNLGDMNIIHEHEAFKKSRGAIDVFCGGTPCQSFSIAGLRKGLDDPRGNLALVFLGIVEKIRPRWVVWENVPGVLSSWTGPEPPSDLEPGQEWETTETSDFGCFLAALSKLGYGWAYRVLDAQYTGVAQRRRRVFVVGHIGDWRRAAAVLFERYSLQRHPTPCKAKGASFTADVAPCLTAGRKSAGSVNQQDVENGMLVFQARAGAASSMNPHPSISPTLDVGKAGAVAVFTQNTRNEVRLEGGDGQIVGVLGANEGAKQKSYLWSIMPQNSGKDYKARKCDVSQPLMAAGNVGGNQGGDFIQTGHSIRRLTPLEWERLQGFPDYYTKIPYKGKPKSKCPDTPRYRSLGNSMAVPVMRWIGERIELVNSIK